MVTSRSAAHPPRRRARRKRSVQPGHPAGGGHLPDGQDLPSVGTSRLVDAAYEKRSIAISSNLHPAAFDELMPKTLAGATVDRLLHHAHVCITTGDSVRLQQATSGKGVTPLT